MTDLHVVAPDAVDDPARPSGGNTYDRRACAGLRSLGWTVHEHPVPGRWPQPDAAALSALGRVTAALPDGALVVVDGLIALCAPDVLVPEAARLRLVVLVHMPLGGGAVEAPSGQVEAGEARVLSAAAAVVTTSAWTRRRLLELYRLDPTRLHVAEPGVDRAPLAPGTPAGGELLCVAAVTPVKGHDQLLAALGRLPELRWRCVCAGALSLDPTFVEQVRGQARRSGIADRVAFVGPLTGDDLDRAYAAADVLVVASRAETYGMVVTESLARGLPVIAMSVGGLPEAVGHGDDGSAPGLLVPAGSTEALAAAIRSWLGDGALRERLRELARQRRQTLSGWTHTAERISAVLARVRP